MEMVCVTPIVCVNTIVLSVIIRFTEIDRLFCISKYYVCLICCIIFHKKMSLCNDLPTEIHLVTCHLRFLVFCFHTFLPVAEHKDRTWWISAYWYCSVSVSSGITVAGNYKLAVGKSGRKCSLVPENNTAPKG